MLGLETLDYSHIEFIVFVWADLEGRGSFRAGNLMGKVQRFFLKVLCPLPACLDLLGDIGGFLGID